MIFSWSFIDYSTSGLENALSYFLVSILLYYLVLGKLQQDIQKIYIILALLLLNRLDYSILFLPLALNLFWKCHSIKRILHAVWPGSLILIAWLFFATIYFGTPLPNTFYAKLSAGYPTNEMLIRGWNYLLSMTDDFTSIVVIVTSITLSIFSRNSILISLSLGQILYLSYIVQAGGDFMLGRHFAILVFFVCRSNDYLAISNQKLEYI